MKIRDNSIDCMKGLLVLVMVLAHVVAVFPSSFFATLISQYANLTTFSGFCFCLGYVCYHAYISKPHPPYKKILKGFGKTLLAFLVSSILCFTLLDNRPFNLALLKDIFLQQDLASYSEFLVSFLYIYLLLLFGCPLLQKILNKRIYLLISVIISISCTFFPYHIVTYRPLGSIIGSPLDHYFPIIQYSCYFLVGAYLAKNSITFSKPLLIISFVSTFAFLTFGLVTHSFPTRFPPSLLWIIGASFFIYCYYLIFKFLDRYQIYVLNKTLGFIGKNSLIYLVVSNGVLSLLRYLSAQTHLNNMLLFYIITYLSTLLVCRIIAQIFTLPAKAQLRHKQPSTAK